MSPQSVNNLGAALLAIAAATEESNRLQRETNEKLDLILAALRNKPALKPPVDLPQPHRSI
jgi:hypothetical protein